MLEIRFTQAARRHRIGRASVRHVLATVAPIGTVMPERQPPRVSDHSPIGPDVDLERDDIRLADGTRLTPDIAAGIAEDVRRAAGRPSLTGPGRHSPQVSARVPAELRDAAEQQARREGKSVSQLIRELLERYLSGSPDGVRH